MKDKDRDMKALRDLIRQNFILSNNRNNSKYNLRYTAID